MVHIHQHRRKRVHQKLEPYPHPKKKFRIIDAVVSATAVIYPLAVLPQLVEIWKYRNVEGVSLSTWVLFLFFTIPLLFYAIAHRDRRLTVMYALFAVLYVALIGGIILIR